MFCTGAAPTVPGISARFSSPGQPASSVKSTKSCQFSPAPASTIQASARSATTRMPRHLDLEDDLRHVAGEDDVAAAAEDELGREAEGGESTTRRTSASLGDAHERVRDRRQAEGVVGSEADPRVDLHGRIFADSLFLAATRTPGDRDAQLRCRPRSQLVEVRNAVDQTAKEIGTRFDFKGSSARVELKDKEITLFADSEFQIGQVMDILLAKLTQAQRRRPLPRPQREDREDRRRQGQAAARRQERHRQRDGEEDAADA